MTEFFDELRKVATTDDVVRSKKIFQYSNDPSTKFLGVRMGTIFKIAKRYLEIPTTEIIDLLDSQFYEVRVGAVSIMDFQARQKDISMKHRKELFEIYLEKHDRINNWGMVDRAAPHVIGGYLYHSESSRDILYKLARSEIIWERRSAIVATQYLISKGETEDTFKLAEILAHDPQELINKAVGSWLREAGKKNPEALSKFLDKYSTSLPRVTLRYAIEKLDEKSRQNYLKRK